MEKGGNIIFNAFDRDHVFIKWAFVIITSMSVAAVVGGYFYMNEQIQLARDSIVVLDRNNRTYIGEMEVLSQERREGQLRAHVEMFWLLFWNVSQERDNIDKSVSRALLMCDDSGVRLYENYYEVQNMTNFLYENSGSSYANIEEVRIDMTVYPYRGWIKSIHELETPYGNSLRRMDATFLIKEYPSGYENPMGAQIIGIEIVNDSPIEDG